MSILITGSSGYFGKVVVSDLIKHGCRVVGIDIRRDNSQEEGEQFRFYKCCITDSAGLREIFKQEQPTDVLHFACTFNKVRSRKREFEIDVGGSANVLEACNVTPSVRRLIYSSSASIYGAASHKDLWIRENEPVYPGKYRYALNKKIIEEALLTGSRRRDLHIIALRVCTVVGPLYYKPRTVVSLLIRMQYLPELFRNKKIQFMHEEDFVNVLWEIINDSEIEGVFNFGSDSYSVVEEVVNGKKYVRIPLNSLKPLLWLLWNMRILNLQPASINYCLYPVLADPSKLVQRYDYTFRHSSSESFTETVRNNSIPADARF